MKIVYLDAKTLGEDLDLSAVSELGEAVIYQNTPQDEVKNVITDADVIIVNKLKLNESNLPYAKNLKLICITATGYDNIDIEYLKNREKASIEYNEDEFDRVVINDYSENSLCNAVKDVAEYIRH